MDATTYKKLADHKVLSQKEINDLVVKAQRGCVESRNKIVESNIKYVLKIVGFYRKFWQKNLRGFQYYILLLVKIPI